MSTIAKRFRVDGTLTDMTSVHLSDATGTFGVKRNDTDAVVVSDGTAMTKTATGTYSHTFTDPANDLTYTAAFEFVYGGETYHVEETFDGPTSGAAGESNLSLEYSDFLAEISKYLGAGDDTSVLTTEESDDFITIMQAGYRQFLYPPPLPPNNKSHVWSFLSPIATFETVSGTGDYDLPDDFGSMAVSDMTVDEDSVWKPFPIVGEGAIRRRRALGTVDGRPRMAAIRPKSSTGTGGQRWEILLDPTPNGAWTIQYRYNILVDKLDATYKYPLGGMRHSDTILASMLAVAELRKGDVKGPMWDDFLTRLAASIQQDTELLPKRLGYNYDASSVPTIRTIRSNYSLYEDSAYGPYAP